LTIGAPKVRLGTKCLHMYMYMYIKIMYPNIKALLVFKVIYDTKIFTCYRDRV
jgi:hypothetical protein